MRRYLEDQFPPIQAVTIGVGVVVVWLSCGRTAGSISFDPLLVAALLTVFLLFLQLRLLDDVHTYYHPMYEDSGDIGGATLAGLIWGVSATTVVIAVVNAAHSSMLLWALGATAVMIAGSVVIRLENAFGPGVRLVLGKLPLFEVAPLAALTYVYVAWQAAYHQSLPALAVAAAVGVVWAGFDVWKLSRHLGERELERVYAIGWPLVRRLCLGLLAIAWLCALVLTREADLSAAYALYTTVVVLLFAWWARPRRVPDLSRPKWVGLAFPLAMIGGLLVQGLTML